VGPVVSVPAGGAITCRVTLTVREMLPLASEAVTVMLLNPTVRGIFADSQVAPVTTAAPDAPELADQVTVAPPLPPVTVPESEIDATLVTDGGASTVNVSGDIATTWRVTFTLWETLPVASLAVTVMVLNPATSGIFVASQFVPVTTAASDAPALDDHVTVAPPLPPVTVPESEIDTALLVDGGASTVRASGDVTTTWRVTLTVWETLPVESVAVIVMLFVPKDRGMSGVTQFAPVTTADPEAPVLEYQVTDAAPLPPVTVPDSEIDDREVTEGAAFTVKASGTAAPFAA
jgi:hypothetical protein